MIFLLTFCLFFDNFYHSTLVSYNCTVLNFLFDEGIKQQSRYYKMKVSNKYLFGYLDIYPYR